MSVVITGAGVVSPIGSSYIEFMEELEKGTIGIDHIKNFNTSEYPISLGAEAKKKGEVYLTEHNVDRKELFAMQAVDELIQNNPSILNYPPDSRMLVLGSGMDFLDIIGYTNSFSSPNPLRDNRNIPQNTISKIKEKYNINGFSSVNVSACVASSQAIGFAYRILKKNQNSLIITGGFDSMLSPLSYMGFFKLGALSEWTGKKEGACRPFDKNRPGIVLGEGAAMFSMQDSSMANKKDILAEIVGYASSCDAYMVTDPRPDGEDLANAAILAIKDAGISPDEIDCVHLHGTGTYKNAIAESNAMQIIFGKRFEQIPVFSLKAQVGHLIGACGAIEMLGVIFSLETQSVPPTPNYDEPDPEVPLYVVKDKPHQMKINTILKLNAAFGGQNTALVVKKYGK